MISYQHGISVQAAGLGALRSGVHGLFRLDGGPLDPREIKRIGLGATQRGSAILEAIDRAEPGASASVVEEACTTCLAGWIDDADTQAQRLGLPADSPVALIARVALDRYGAETPLQLGGEWTLLQWDERSGAVSVTAMASAARRDPVHFAHLGANVAISSDLHALARLDWVDGEIDEVGLFTALGRAPLREKAQGRTIYRGVRLLEPGQGLVFSSGAAPRPLQCNALALPVPWRGNAEEAFAEAESLLRRIMRERIARAGTAALLLSGGLDSTLLTWAAVAESGPDTKLLTFTSAAPPACAVADEIAEARMVADYLGLANFPIVPGPELDSYCPAPKVLAGANGPLLSNRHCLTEAFQQAARMQGAKLLVNGTYGEGTLTARIVNQGPWTSLRGLGRRLLGRGEGSVSGQANDRFHVQLAPHRLASLPRELIEPAVTARSEVARGQFGFLQVAPKALAHPNAFHADAVRMDFPFRDLRLLRFFASLPEHMVRSFGADRGLARRMLVGRVPDAIVGRRIGRPADPDHFARLQRQAPAARARIAGYRQAGLDDWLDLDWLERELARVAQQGVSSVDHANRTQLTAIAAEYLMWLQDGARA